MNRCGPCLSFVHGTDKRQDTAFLRASREVGKVQLDEKVHQRSVRKYDYHRAGHLVTVSHVKNLANWLPGAAAIIAAIKLHERSITVGRLLPDRIEITRVG